MLLMWMSRVALGGVLLGAIVCPLSMGCTMEGLDPTPKRVQAESALSQTPALPEPATIGVTDTPLEVETCDVCSRKAKAGGTATPIPTEALSATVALRITPSTTPTPTPIHKPAAGAPTHITAPAIDLDVPVVLVDIVETWQDGVSEKRWEVADDAAGFHRGTAWPGHVGNTVITGHNNIRGKVFGKVYKLKLGDEVHVLAGGVPYRYRVSEIHQVPIAGASSEDLEQSLRWILPTSDQRLTLVTCGPAWSNTHRILVVAFPIPWD
jgi:sortase A